MAYPGGGRHFSTCKGAQFQSQRTICLPTHPVAGKNVHIDTRRLVKSKTDVSPTSHHLRGKTNKDQPTD
jgi:hypothetical protein